MRHRIRAISFFGGAGALLLLAAANARDTTLLLSLDAQFMLLLLGAAAVVFGLGANMPHRFALRFGAQGWALLLLTLVALALRLWQAGALVHYFVDELNFVEGVLGVQRAQQSGEALALLHPFHWLAAFPRLYPYWQSWGTALAGHDLAGLRLASALIGALTVPAVYFCGRQFFDRKVALLAALLLATFPPHLHFSRLALNNVADPLFATLALAFAARGLRTGRHGDCALAGALLGASQYFYEGGRLLYPAVMALWLIFAARKQPGQIAVCALAFALVALPLYSVTLSYQLPLMPRLADKGLGEAYWRDLLLSPPERGLLAQHAAHMAKAFLIYVTYPDESFYYGGHAALLLAYLVPPFLLGVARALRCGPRVLPLLLLLAALGNSLLRFSAWAAGFVVTFPALCLLTAWGCCALWGWARAYFSRLRWRQGVGSGKRKIYQVILLRLPWSLLIALLLAGAQVGYYFALHLPGYNLQLRPVADAQDALFRALEFPAGTRVHLVGDIVFYEFDRQRMLAFLGRGDLQVDIVRHIAEGTEFTAAYLLALARDVDQAFFIERAEDAALLQQYFVVQGPFYSPYNVPPERQLALYYYEAAP
ncbi:MAG: glycosyltransferase family 39 protein [Chloroflexi bacterium]|nr:glycosyltransferase family 39 protein [Chloroflexota bacterium]